MASCYNKPTTENVELISQKRRYHFAKKKCISNTTRGERKFYIDAAVITNDSIKLQRQPEQDVMLHLQLGDSNESM